jgi:trehalose 6-phosphate phosphatase
VLPREGAEAVACALVRHDGLVVCVPRIRGDLLRHRPYLALDRVAVGRVAEERLDPALGAVPVGNVVVEQELAEQDPGADVRKGPEGEDPVRRLDARREGGVVSHDAVDDAADRLVHERDPELIEFGHDRIMPAGEVAYARVAGPDDLLAELAAKPAETGLFLDFDGVLAPIVERPEDAAPPPETRDELERLIGRYGLVAVVSGRAGEDVRARVGVDGVVCVGSHGLELEPGAERWRQVLAAFATNAPWPQRQIEVKGLAVTFHFRSRPDEDVAIRELDAIAESAACTGLTARYGRKVLEVLPPIRANKGTAVRRLLEEHGLRRALAAGDDTTDLDSFAALDGLDLAVRVAVTSGEAPGALLDAADLLVGSTGEFLELLRQL